MFAVQILTSDMRLSMAAWLCDAAALLNSRP